MATFLRTNVLREVRGPDGTTLVVILAPAGLLIREKGKRTTYGPISYGALFSIGAKQEAEAARREAEAESERPRKVKRGLI